MRKCQQVVLASTNRKKFEEIASLLMPYPSLELLPIQRLIRNADKLQLVEVYSTYRENAIAKARLAHHGCHYPILADDSGLEVEALGGRPGIKSHRYASAATTSSQDQANRAQLLEELAHQSNRRARLVCVLVLL